MTVAGTGASVTDRPVDQPAGGRYATASTSIRTSGSNRPATWTSVLVGGDALSTNSSRTDRIVASSETSTTKIESLTTSLHDAPPASSARPRFWKTSRVCASQ